MKYEVLKIAISLLPVAFLRETLDVGQKQSEAKVRWKSAVAQAAGTGRASRPAMGRGAATVPFPSPPTPALYGSCFSSLSSSAKSWGRRAWGFGEKEPTVAKLKTQHQNGREGKEREWQGKMGSFSFPLTTGIPNTDPLSLCPASTPLHYKTWPLGTAVTEPATAGHKCTWKGEALSHLLQWEVVLVRSCADSLFCLFLLFLLLSLFFPHISYEKKKKTYKKTRKYREIATHESLVAQRQQ